MEKRVLLISMPFGALERQALGLSILKARLTEEAIPCDLRYLAFAFAEMIGTEDYYFLSNDIPHTAFAGEWIFARALYGDAERSPERYLREVLEEEWQLAAESISRVVAARTVAEPFVAHCLEAIPWKDYAVVGFTSTFEQNLASLALAKRIKSLHPEIKIVFGGANWEEEMGVALHEHFGFVDYVCSGESEESFPALVRRLLSGDESVRAARRIPGLVYRQNGRSVSTGPAEPIKQMDRLPIPDYADYFRDFEASSTGDMVVPTILFEGSRGCWWGCKRQCKFCGLNGGTMQFRAKSSKRVLRELETLVDHWGVDNVQAVDNVVNMRFFREVFPSLRRSGRRLDLFFEIRANLKRHHVRLLQEAGVTRVQPGIESLNNRVLRLMRKGTTALQNVQVLKWCKEYGVGASWNLLYGFPGEQRPDYSRTLQLLPAIRFLDPPTACGPIRLDRFSPYFREPKKYGLVNLRPLSAYRHIYPFNEPSLHRIAYYFDFDYEPRVDPRGHADDVIAYVNTWQHRPESGTLESVVRSDGKLMLVDSRSGRLRDGATLDGMDRTTYEYCDEMRSLKMVVGHLRRRYPKRRFSEMHVRKFLDSLVRHGWMLCYENDYLSLALRRPPVYKNGRAIAGE
jgi:ribosomal peptide maturation radical SAM protein 1